MKNKKILIGTLIGLGLIGGYFLFKNKKAKDVLNDDATGGNVDFDYENASGNSLVDILNRTKKKHLIPVKKYQTFLKSSSLSEMKKYFLGKNIYTLVNDVNIREEPYVNNGIIDNIIGTVKNKGVFLGKVSYVLKNTDDNKIWFGITQEEDSNKFISRVFGYPRNNSLYYNDPALYMKDDKQTLGHIPRGITIRWVRADVVVVDLSDDRILKNKYEKYYFQGNHSNGHYEG